jgi:ureidoglycolate lyase
MKVTDVCAVRADGRFRPEPLPLPGFFPVSRARSGISLHDSRALREKTGLVGDEIRKEQGMRAIKAKRLSLEAFRIYGCYRDLYDIEDMRRGLPGDSGFYPDLVVMNLGNTTLPAACVAKVKKQPENIVRGLEYHRYTAEGLLPLDGDCFIFVGRACKGFDPEQLEAFVVPKGVFVKINPGVVHGTQFPVRDEWIRVLVILPERTYDTDTVRKPLTPGEEVEVLP